MPKVTSIRFGRSEKDQAFADQVVRALRETTLRESFCAAPPAGSKSDAPQPSPGFRIRPAEADQDPDPEDAW